MSVLVDKKVVIVILNWNGIEDTSDCLESLMLIDYDNYEIVIVDNHSKGNDVQILKEKYGDYCSSIIVNTDNLGFSAGNNVGIKEALKFNPDYILLLNNDTVVEPDFLSKLLEKTDGINKIGILTPMINFYSNKEIIWSAGGYLSKIRATGFSFGYGQNMRSYSEDKTCSFASGCCMLISTEVINEIGMLDEKYFLYLEDTDFCFRTLKAGYNILYVGSSRIYHKVAASSKDKNSLFYYSIRNRLYYARKNLGYYFYISLIYLVFSTIYKIIFTFDSKAINPVLNAYKDFFAKKFGKKDYLERRNKP